MGEITKLAANECPACYREREYIKKIAAKSSDLCAHSKEAWDGIEAVHYRHCTIYQELGEYSETLENLTRWLPTEDLSDHPAFARVYIRELRLARGYIERGPDGQPVPTQKWVDAINRERKNHENCRGASLCGRWELEAQKGETGFYEWWENAYLEHSRPNMEGYCARHQRMLAKRNLAKVRNLLKRLVGI